MISYIDQDILTMKTDCILHVCNCFNTQGAGIALRLRPVYLSAYQADLKTIRGCAKKLGTFSIGKEENGPWVYNLYAQYMYGRDRRQLNYEAFFNSMSAAKIDIEFHSKKTVAIPYRIGCHNAGGNWNIIVTMIQEIWHESECSVYIANY